MRICIVINAAAFALSLLERDAFFACMSGAVLTLSLVVNRSMRRVVL